MLGKSGPLGSIQDKCTDNDGNGVVLWYAYVTLVTGRVGGEVFGCLAMLLASWALVESETQAIQH